MRSRSSRAVWRAVSLLLAVSVVAAGCTSASSRPHASTATPGPGLPSGVTGATNVPTSVPNNPTRRQDVTLATCSAVPGGWTAGGTVRNRAAKASTYRMTVFFTTTSATVIGVASTSVSVPGGSSKPWQTVGHFHAPAKALCVLRGVA